MLHLVVQYFMLLVYNKNEISKVSLLPPFLPYIHPSFFSLLFCAIGHKFMVAI